MAKKKNKDEVQLKGVHALEGFDRFNRVSQPVNILLNVIFALMALACVIPVLLVVGISLSHEDSITQFGYHFIPKIWSADGYTFIVERGTMIIRALCVSLFVTIVGTILGTSLTTVMGYVLSRRTYKLHGFLTILIFIPMVFGGGLVASYFVTRQFLHLGDKIWVLILPLMVSSFNIIVCRTFFTTTVPDELIESAKIDGAAQLRIFGQIVIPISLPVVATIALRLAFGYWNDWYQSMLYIDSNNLLSLQALLNEILTNIQMLASMSAQLGAAAAEQIANMPRESARMAVVVVIVLPIACAYPFFQRYFISGLTVGAVKG